MHHLHSSTSLTSAYAWTRLIRLWHMRRCPCALSVSYLWQEPTPQPPLVLDVTCVGLQSINPVMVARDGKGCRALILMQQLCRCSCPAQCNRPCNLAHKILQDTCSMTTKDWALTSARHCFYMWMLTYTMVLSLYIYGTVTLHYGTVTLHCQ